MFKTSSDRLNYGNIIAPPNGYILDKAIGTTYSLDLETLTAICISLGLIEETDSELIKNPISMLNALQKVSEKILIFCEAGQIKMPSTPSPLCILLEKMVVEMRLPYDRRIGRFPAFHPKTWVLVYVNDAGERQYKFVNLSRNLTFDRSWDVSVVLDGKPVGASEKTGPIIDFLGFLKDKGLNQGIDKARQKKLLSGVIKELENVTFEIDKKEFYDFGILPLGIGNGAADFNKELIFRETFNEAVVMSPFLTSSVIAKLNASEKGLTDVKRTLITRKSELTKLKPEDASRFDIYVLKDDIIDGEDSLSDEELERQKQDIHAKIYVYRKYSDSRLYLGSMNASYAAMNSNVEMMVRLCSKNRYFNGEAFLTDIFGGPADGTNNPFELVNLGNVKADEVESEADKLEQSIKKICRMNGKAYVVANGEKYDLRIEFSGYENLGDIDIVIAPLRSNKTAKISEVVEIHELEALQISQFYSLIVKGKETQIQRIIMIPTSGLPEDRENQVVQSVVANKKSFIEYVAFVLGDDYLLSIMESRQLANSGVYKGREGNMMPAVYEKMLKTSLEEPEKLGEINYLMRMIDDEEIIPEEFRRMYETFKTTLKLK